MDFTDFIQVAGVHDQAEAELLVNCGVRFLGFPLRLPVHQADLGEEAAATIIRTLEPHARGVVITYLNRASEIVEFCDSLGASIVQLHGEIEASELRIIKKREPGLVIIKSLVTGLHSPAQLAKNIACTASFVDAYITDTYDPVTGASGATGKTHDWAISRQLVQRSPRPVIMAGGLNPGNVREAILEVFPAGVDAHSGLEDASGRKSEQKVLAFVRQAHSAFRLMHRGAV